MIASLPMYWRSENADSWRAFWAEVQRHVDLPDLTPPENIPDPWTDHWLRPDLALSMTCGLPFRTALREQVTYVGTLDFGFGHAGHYYSQAIGQDGPRLAYNSNDSQSGWAVVEQKAGFETYIETGGHAESLAVVADGRADVAYIDAVTWRLLKRFDPKANQVPELRRSIASPGLPFITAKGRDPEPLRTALSHAIARFEGDENLGSPRRLTVLDVQEYLSLPVPVAVPQQ